MPSDAAALRVRGLSRTLGERRAFAGVSLTIRRGEAIALIGAPVCEEPAGALDRTRLADIYGPEFEDALAGGAPA